MSIMKQYPGNLPKDAVVLTEDQAVTHQLELISNWDKWSEVWPLKSGISILGITSSLTGIYVNGFYRRKFRLGRYGYMSTYIPIVVLPGMISATLHKALVTYDIILEKMECPLCTQVKAAIIQCGIGCLYPMILAPLGNAMHATRHATYRLPNLMTDFRGTSKLLIRLARPIGTQLSVIFVGQAMLGSYFTYLEAKSYYTVKQRMLEIEREYDNNSRYPDYDEK